MNYIFGVLHIIVVSNYKLHEHGMIHIAAIA